MDAPPARLYKYVSPHRIDSVLGARHLRFTQPSRLNDTFEFYPTTISYVRPLVRALVLDRLKVEYRARMAARHEALLAHLGEQGKEVGLLDLPAEVEEELRNDESPLVRALHRAARKASLKIGARGHDLLVSARDRIDSRFGVLSLAERADSVLLWSHYADCHRGFVLELDAAHPFFDQRTYPHDPLRRLQQVQYRPGPPAVALFEQKYWLRSVHRAALDLLEYTAGLFLLTKGTEWAYEHEWRMILPLGRADDVKRSREGEVVYLFTLPAKCIRGVILGSEVSTPHRKRIEEALGENLTHVELRCARRDARRFRVVVEEHPSVLENRLLEDIGAFPQHGIRQRIERLEVSAPRFYAATRSLSGNGLITAPTHQRGNQEKRFLGLTTVGQALLAKRRQAARVLEEEGKSPTSRLLDSLVRGVRLGSSEQLDAQFEAAVDEDLRKGLDKVVQECLHEYRLRMNETSTRETRSEPGAGADLIESWLRSSQVEDENRTEALFAALSDADEDAHWDAAARLRKTGDARIVEHLAAILRWRDDEELAWLQDPTTELEDEEIEEIEARAPEAYRMLSDRRAWGSDELSRLAAFALAGIAIRIDAAEAIDALIQALRDPDEDVRWYATDALGHLGSARALPHLERLTKEDAAESSCGLVADAARRAIERVLEAQRRGSPRK